MGKDDLNDRIAKAQAKIDAQERPARMSTGKGMGLGFRMASDFAAAVIVGVILGLGIDAVFKVSPWATIICLLLGFVAGVRNVVATATKANSAPQGDVTKGEGDGA
ncbi:MAG: AtpZ/AtpI family protein [Hyphomonadaceae bacterium]|nr:AtpZ/AtpI family protein [Hyphomonadaceae bacterium]